ncbi:MAG: hypothetical protein QXO42_06700 [Ignisphaera sp.]
MVKRQRARGEEKKNGQATRQRAVEQTEVGRRAQVAEAISLLLKVGKTRIDGLREVYIRFVRRMVDSKNIEKYLNHFVQGARGEGVHSEISFPEKDLGDLFDL